MSLCEYLGTPQLLDLLVFQLWKYLCASRKRCCGVGSRFVWFVLQRLQFRRSLHPDFAALLEMARTANGMSLDKREAVYVRNEAQAAKKRKAIGTRKGTTSKPKPKKQDKANANFDLTSLGIWIFQMNESSSHTRFGICTPLGVRMCFNAFLSGIEVYHVRGGQGTGEPQRKEPLRETHPSKIHGWPVSERHLRLQDCESCGRQEDSHFRRDHACSKPWQVRGLFSL